MQMTLDAGPPTKPITDDTRRRAKQARDALDGLLESLLGTEFWGKTGVVLHWQEGQIVTMTQPMEPTFK